MGNLMQRRRRLVLRMARPAQPAQPTEIQRAVDHVTGAGEGVGKHTRGAGAVDV